MKRFIVSLGMLLQLVSCSKQEAPSQSNQTPAVPVVVTPTTPVIPTNFKNYLTTSLDLRKSDLWIDNYAIPKSNGINVSNIFYDCPITIADFNNDGYDDVLMAPSKFPNDNKRMPLELYINDKTNSSFKLDTSKIINNIGTNNARKGIVGDFNKDGKPDVVYAESGVDAAPFTGSNPSILLSTPTGYEFKILLTDTWFGHGVCSGDIDNDGDLDLYFTGTTDKSFLLINDGKGNFTNTPSKLIMSNYGVFTAEFKDINKDGFLDLIAGGDDYLSDKNNQPLRVFLGNGINYDSTRSIKLPTVPSWGVLIDINSADLDGDGIDEIIINRTQDRTANFYQGFRIQILKNVGNYVYQDITDKIIQDYTSNTIKWIIWLRVEDIDKNGKLDIFDSDKGHYNTGVSLRWEKDTDGIFKRK